MRTLVGLLVTSTFFTVPALAQDPAPQAAPTQLPLPSLKEEIDLSVRWLRSRQDRLSGAYAPPGAATIEPTALVLRALAKSPRQYVRRDGPFVSMALDHLIAHQDESGWIAAEDTDGDARLAQTRAAAAALYLYVDPASTAALAKAVGWLGEQGISDPAAREGQPVRDREQAARRAVELLATRSEDGSWRGEVVATAENVLELSAYYPLLREASSPARSATRLPRFTAADREAVDAAILRGARFLVGAAEEGKWGAPSRPDAGITAMVLGALLAVPEPRPEEIQTVIDDGLDWLAGLQREDGSIHQGMLANYVTSASILALSGSSDEEHAQVVERARGFLVALQADEGEGYSPDHPFYGGIGYGGDERPDLSNLQMALEALVASGLDSDHEAFQRSLRFLERCQNRSESNDLVIVGDDGTRIVSGDDGGSAYTPGSSKAGYVELEDGRRIPRSYGSMTYALLKGYVFAGLERDDPRVEAAWKWLQEHYTLDVNPGFEHASDPTAPYQGLFYYFHSMARALNLFGEDTVVDAQGVAHAWRGELAGRLIAMQSKLDGSWVNENAPRWWEGNPVLATSYALLALEQTKGAGE